MRSPRYQGNPLLRLLECLGLKVINELSAPDVESLRSTQSKLSQVYGKHGSWDQVIAATMECVPSQAVLVRSTYAQVP